MKKYLLATAVAALLLGSAPLVLARDAASANSESGSQSSLPSAALSVLNATRFTDLQGQVHQIKEWRGHLLLVNFWATWCAPCLRELPVLIEAQQNYGPRGLQIIGLAVDAPSAAREEKGILGINYPIMVNSPTAMLALAEKLGDHRRSLPYSVLVGPNGTIIARHSGEFHTQDLDTLITPHLPH